MQNQHQVEGAQKLIKKPARRSRGGRKKKQANQMNPKNFNFKFGGYSEGDRFRDEVLRVVRAYSDRDLTKQEQNLASAMLDPGHSFQAMKDASAFPDDQSTGNEIFQNPCQLDLDINVLSGKTCLIFAINHPLIACLIVNDGVWSAVPWPETVVGKNPGRYFVDKGILAFRKLAGGITVHNATPSNDRGGMCYSDIIRTSWINQSPSIVVSPPTTTDVNNPTIYGLPGTAADFLSSDSYQTESDRGAYAIARPTSFEFKETANGVMALSGIYPRDTAIGAGDKEHQMRYLKQGSSKTDLGTPLTYLSTLTTVGSKPVIVPFDFDSFEVPSILYQSPSRDQLLHVKLHALWEYQMEADLEAGFSKKLKTPNKHFVDSVKEGMAQFPQLLPPEYNSWGAVGRWFQNLYKGLKPALDPLISASVGPLGGNAINTALDSLSRVKI